MKNKLKSYLSILAITCAVAVPLLSANAHELPVQASLTAPSDYDYFFQPYDNPSPAPDFWRLGDWNGTNSNNGSNDLRFTRTPDSTYFNYSITTNHSSHSFLPDGLEITMTFNRSNTSWTLVSGTSLYNPTDYTKIGSDNTVGTTTNKLRFLFTNNTNKEYRLYFDFSSIGVTYNQIYSFLINSINYGDGGSTNPSTILYVGNALVAFHFPAYSILELSSSTSNTRYFDAWYLQELGVSASYDAGYDAGYDVGEDDGYQDGLDNNPNVLINGFESLIGMFVNFTFIIFSLEIFGISILSIVGVLFGIVAIVWILKTIRG